MKKGYNLDSWSESSITCNIEFLAGLLAISNFTMLENLPGLCPLECSLYLYRDMINTMTVLFGLIVKWQVQLDGAKVWIAQAACISYIT